MENFAPDYYVRIITDNDEIVLRNIMSISTSKDINGDVGNFSITLDYNQNAHNASFKNTVMYNQQSIFFKIKPMDYVEIYMKRTPGNFGIYDKNGKYLRPFEKGKPCNIVERVSNPHLVLCGFVDGMNNSFSPGDSSTSNSITIDGSCLAKILNVHHLFFTFPYWEFFTQQATAGLALIGARPHEAVDTILTTFCISIFDPQNSIILEDSKVDKSKVKSVKQKQHISQWLPKNSNKTIKIIHNVAPSFRNIYWGVNKNTDTTGDKSENNGFFSWGRMEYMDNPGKNPYNVTSEQPVLSILKDIAQTNTNEFFIDETGNIVIRSQLDAWDYSHSFNNEYAKDIVTIFEEDIHSWNFNISDNELKTVVLDTMADAIYGIQQQMVAGTGVAPLDDTTANRFLNDKTQDKDFQKTIKRIKKAQGKHLDVYDLSTQQGVVNFWAKYGLRPHQVTDIYATTPAKAYENAWTWFQKFSNYWWKGSITVKGDAKYKIGQKGRIRDFALDINNEIKDFNFYIQGVSHNFSWGNSWTTTLTFTRGEIQDTFLSQDIKVKTK